MGYTTAVTTPAAAGIQPGQSAAQAVVEIKGVSKAFGPVAAVRQFSLDVCHGELLAILGPSGCGKTTLLRLIAGFERPMEGEIALNGRIVSSATTWTPPEKRGIGMVFQDFAVFPHMTVSENVAFGLSKLDQQAKARRLREVLDLVGMREMALRYPYQLSGGQQQRVALARALAPNPVVILMDEPFSNLDADLRSQMRREVHGILKQAGATAVLVTHDQEEAMLLADRVAVMNAGRLDQVGTPEEVYHKPSTRFAARFVGLADFLPATLKGNRVQTELGLFTCQSPISEGEVDLMVRPDDVHVVPERNGDAEVVGREFRGSENIYTLKLPSGRTIRSSQPSTLVYAVGQRVQAVATLDHVVVFPRR